MKLRGLPVGHDHTERKRPPKTEYSHPCCASAGISCLLVWLATPELSQMDLSLRYMAITKARRERCVVFHAAALLLLITALKSLMKSLRAREKQSPLLLFFPSDAEQSHLAESSECEGRSNQNNSVLHAASHPPRLEVRGGG